MKIEEIKTQPRKIDLTQYKKVQPENTFIDNQSLSISQDDMLAFMSGAELIILAIVFIFLKKIKGKYLNKQTLNKIKESKLFKLIKKEKAKIISGLILIFIIFSFYSSHFYDAEVEKKCTLEIDYRVKYFKYKDKRFKTKADAMEYCTLTSKEYER